MAMNAIQLGLRLWEFLWTLLVMALIGNMIAGAFSGNPATVNYAMFVSAFSMFTLFYLVPATINIDWAIHPIIVIVVDTLNAIFFLTAGIALAARLEAHSCSNNEYTLHNEVTNGSVHREKRCREAQASTAFLWLAWAGYTASIALSTLAARRAVSHRPRVGPARGARPSMAQV
ncbi:non-classical export protein Nce2 [Aspergillus nomiae NRRL 13137]|uniref:Non-classical export protein Nce2 n=1 Tax=Aspergillus nomiae NRRL (strain ATCC 15546 / NRRL 13137 / CBS 260.88 / M93) TaxID=1509407 RepID=A0A0L1JCD4_ASPN3|nr:non-classical export protein Nce2 [Aspergillus nomiae NRRL 13137]KNG89409.1 non-classical export protein Nce2 [Aspergillus nomiae NRRL 13137]